MTQNSTYQVRLSEVHNDLSSRKSISTIGFMILVIFAFLRPITLTFVNIEVLGLSAFEIFGILISYMLLIPVLLKFRSLRLDRMVLLSMYFCLYCIVSIFWGSAVSIVARVTLPFIVFFAIRIYITDSKQVGVILLAIVAGYLIPIAMSTYDTILGQSVNMVNYWTGITRFEGVFKGAHAFAYAMLFFSFIFCLLNQTRQFEGNLAKYGLLIFQLLAVFCLYKSYTRTALGGFIIFWTIYLWGTNKKRFFLAVMACLVIAVLSYQKIETIFWQTGGHARTGYHNLDAASSGRIYIWNHNIQLFLDSSLPQQLLGRGLGCESRTVIGSEVAVWQPHNNYLNLLMSVGVIGLFIYLSLLAFLLWDIYRSGLDKSRKCLFTGIIVSTAIMNFLSNAVVFRVELSQYFWLFMGLFYFYKERDEVNQASSIEHDKPPYPPKTFQW